MSVERDDGTARAATGRSPRRSRRKSRRLPQRGTNGSISRQSSSVSRSSDSANIRGTGVIFAPKQLGMPIDIGGDMLALGLPVLDHAPAAMPPKISGVEAAIGVHQRVTEIIDRSAGRNRSPEALEHESQQRTIEQRAIRRHANNDVGSDFHGPRHRSAIKHRPHCRERAGLRSQLPTRSHRLRAAYWSRPRSHRRREPSARARLQSSGRSTQSG